MNLQQFCESRDCSLIQLSYKAGVSMVYLYELNRGSKKNPSLKITKAISKALGVSIEDIDKIFSQQNEAKK